LNEKCTKMVVTIFYGLQQVFQDLIKVTNILQESKAFKNKFNFFLNLWL